MRRRTPATVLLLLLTAGSGCRPPPSPRPSLILWHTFNREESETLAVLLGTLPLPRPVASVVVPFPRAYNTFVESLRAGTACPDVFRAELAWVPALGAEALLDARGGTNALPHSRDGLALLYNRDLVPAPPRTLDEFVKTAHAATQGGHFGFYVRPDAYWFLPFLYGTGGDLIDFDKGEVYVDRPPAIAALALYRSLLEVAPPLAVAGDYEEQERRFGAGEIAMIENGPWAAADLLGRPAFRDHPERLGIARLWATPVSGHAYVVPRCAADKEAAWALAQALASPAAQTLFAERNGLVPADPNVRLGSDLVAAFAAALASGRTRPAHPKMVGIFDDFHPAVQAVLRDDATPREALEGVARAWRRLILAPEGPR
jgi:arabinogalactan oligomer/maltooligosaccharide transport system substrate-binding protein